MNARIFFWSLTSALAGFLFGFDTVVISGAEKTIQALWGLSDSLHGIAMASALYGTVVGSLVGGWPAGTRMMSQGSTGPSRVVPDEVPRMQRP